jgi:signal transduction histidine kinase
MPHADAPTRRLAAFLREHREELIQTWTRRVLDDPRLGSANRLTEPDLHDHIPEIIDEIVRVLDASHASEACGRELGSSPAAKEHARQRRSRGFALAEAIREFSHFRAALVDLCTAEGVPLEGDGAELVHAAIDETMVTGASEIEEATVAEMEQRALLRERFLGIVGHDLRTPLQSILFAVETLLKREDTTPHQGRVLRRAVASAERMERMIRDVLDLTRARLGTGIPIDRRVVPLDAICRQVVDELSMVHADRTVELDAPVTAVGSYDPDRIAQVVANLAGNALTYSPPGAPVRVVLREEGGWAVLTVHNRGAAIPAEEQRYLFDPFRRARPKGNAPADDDGLGLGLFIVAQIVAAHGGSVAVTSTTEAGTTFTVRLPRDEKVG